MLLGVFKISLLFYYFMNVELISIFSVSILAFLDTMLLSWSRSAIEKNIETSLLKSFFDQDPCHTVCYTFEKQDLLQ